MPAPRIAKIRIRTGDCPAHDTPGYRISLAPASYGSGHCEASLVPLVKRSLTLHGHRTSLALEPEFWDALDAMAARDGVSLPTLVAGIDDARHMDPVSDAPALSSALRVAALGFYRNGGGLTS